MNIFNDWMKFWLISKKLIALFSTKSLNFAASTFELSNLYATTTKSTLIRSKSSKLWNDLFVRMSQKFENLSKCVCIIAFLSKNSSSYSFRFICCWKKMWFLSKNRNSKKSWIFWKWNSLIRLFWSRLIIYSKKKLF